MCIDKNRVIGQVNHHVLCNICLNLLCTDSLQVCLLYSVVCGKKRPVFAIYLCLLKFLKDKNSHVFCKCCILNELSKNGKCPIESETLTEEMLMPITLLLKHILIE